MRLEFRFILVLAMGFAFSLSVHAQDVDEPKTSQVDSGKLALATFKEGMAKAKKQGKPLVIFGLTDT